MNKEKQTYEAPEAETLVVRFEGVVCTSPGQNQSVDNPQNYGGISGWE